MSIYITTAISYTNGSPHIGHVYETILADFIKKQFQLINDDVKLLTGTDEHGKKIEDSAKNENMEPKKYCDKYADIFLQMNKKLKIDFDYFIRTTDKNHIELVNDCIIKSIEKEDIYLDKYEGYYSLREESFISNTVAELNEFKDPINGVKYEYIKEESYFFKLSKHIEIINKTIKKIYPKNYKKGIKDRLKNLDTLNDLSITRTGFQWGIEFPENDKHIVYVWFDALLNYITGLKELYKKEKPDKIIHIIGKDITWFHSVIYPAILKSCFDDYYPTQILVHGFICDKDGKKMSKSIGNVISPQDLNNYPIEAIRFYMLSFGIGSDISFSISEMIERYNNILVHNFGNLVQRLGNLCYECNDEINEADIEIEEYDFSAIIDCINKYDLVGYNSIIFKLTTEANMKLTNEKPWKNIKKIEILKKLLFKLNIITKLLYPYIPEKIKQIRNIFGFNENMKLIDTNIDNLKINFRKGQRIFNLINV